MTIREEVTKKGFLKDQRPASKLRIALVRVPTMADYYEERRREARLQVLVVAVCAVVVLTAYAFTGF